VSADLPPEAVEAAAKAEYEAEWTAELERLRGEAEAAERWRQLAAHVATRRDELSAEPVPRSEPSHERDSLNFPRSVCHHVGMAGKASGRTRACGRPASFAAFKDARLWARVGARATRSPWTVRRVAGRWHAAPERPKVDAS